MMRTLDDDDVVVDKEDLVAHRIIIGQRIGRSAVRPIATY